MNLKRTLVSVVMVAALGASLTACYTGPRPTPQPTSTSVFVPAPGPTDADVSPDAGTNTPSSPETTAADSSAK